MRSKLLLVPMSVALCAGSAEAALLANARGNYQTTSAGGTTANFNAGAGLSDSVGTGRWNYFGGASLLTFGPAGNAGQSMYATTGQPNNLPALGDKQIFTNVIGPAPDEIQMHAGVAGLPATMTWTAGASVSNLAIRGDIQHGVAVGSAKFDILVNGVNSFSTTLVSTTPAAFSLAGLSIAAGQKVEFILSDNGNGTGGDIADLRAAIFNTGAGVPGLLFSETFNGFNAPAGNFNGGQFQTSLPVAFSGSVPGWSQSGAGTVHAVDRANVFPNIVNPRDFAVMIFGGGGAGQQNVITLNSAIAGSNVLGTQYQLSFEDSPAVYQAGSQATNSTDGLLIELLRASDNAVLHSFTHLPGAWAGVFNPQPVSFMYTGNGTGDLILRIGPGGTSALSGRFGGGIDNLTLTALAAIPEPSTCVLAIVGLAFLQRRRPSASGRALA